jgi:hypothetical protein
MAGRIVAVLVLSALLLSSACAASSPASTADRGRTSESAAAPKAAAPPAPAPAQSAARPASGGAGNAAPAADQAQQTLPSVDRMIIRTVTMTIAVNNVQEAFRQVETLASEQQGYLSGSQIRQDGDRLTATMTLRVPADNATFQATLERLRGIAERVVDEQSQAQDVTEEYVDLDARLRTLKASEESLLALLGKAQKVEDILQIQRELTNVRSQVEQIQGRKQVLERRADLATITLTIREAGSFTRAGWTPGGTFEEAVRALGSALRGVTSFAIWLLVFSPIWGGALVIGYFGLKLLILVLRRLFRAPTPRPGGARTTEPTVTPNTPAGPSTGPVASASPPA